MPTKISVKDALKFFDFSQTHVDEDVVGSCDNRRIKRRRTVNPDNYQTRIMASDDFLCPAREYDSNNRMATAGLFSAGVQHSSTLQRNLETKENIISIGDDDDDDNEDYRDSTAVGEYSHNNGAKPKQNVFQWHVPQPFSNRELYLSQNKSVASKKVMDPDIEVVNVVEPAAQRAERVGNIIIASPSFNMPKPYKRAVFLDSKREEHPRYLAKFTQMKSKSSPQISVTNKKPTPLRKTSMNESIRLDEKKKYRELLQTFTRVPLSSPRLRPLRPSYHEDKRKGSLAATARCKHPGPVEIIDLTKSKQREPFKGSVQSEVEMKDKGLPYSLASKIGDMALSEDKFDHRNTLERKYREKPIYDVNWAENFAMMYDKKSLDRRRLLEQENLKVALKSKSRKEILDDALAEKIRLHMRITEVALKEEVIDLDDDEELKLPRLTPQMERMVNIAFQRGNPGEVLVEAFNQRITRRDMLTLSGCNWLNDEVINFYMNLLIERGKQAKYPSMYGFNTFFYPKLASSGHASLKRWTRKVDVFAHNILIVPVHLGVHWCMAAIDMRKKTIRYYDSMGGANRSCLRDLMKYLEDEMMDKKKQKFDAKSWSSTCVENIPQQMNGSDCGMFACMYSEFICRDAKIKFSQSDMPYFRRKMAYEILTKKLLL